MGFILADGGKPTVMISGRSGKKILHLYYSISQLGYDLLEMVDDLPLAVILTILNTNVRFGNSQSISLE